MIALDTNVLVRYITNDEAAQVEIVRRFFEQELSDTNRGFVAHIVLCELAWVLEADGWPADQVANTLELILRTSALEVEAPEMALGAIDGYRARAADFADLILLEHARAAGAETLATFDRKFARNAGVRLLS